MKIMLDRVAGIAYLGPGLDGAGVVSASAPRVGIPLSHALHDAAYVAFVGPQAIER